MGRDGNGWIGKERVCWKIVSTTQIALALTLHGELRMNRDVKAVRGVFCRTTNVIVVNVSIYF